MFATGTMSAFDIRKAKLTSASLLDASLPASCPLSLQHSRQQNEPDNIPRLPTVLVKSHFSMAPRLPTGAPGQTPTNPLLDVTPRHLTTTTTATATKTTTPPPHQIQNTSQHHRQTREQRSRGGLPTPLQRPTWGPAEQQQPHCRSSGYPSAVSGAASANTESVTRCRPPMTVLHSLRRLQRHLPSHAGSLCGRALHRPSW